MGPDQQIEQKQQVTRRCGKWPGKTTKKREKCPALGEGKEKNGQKKKKPTTTKKKKKNQEGEGGERQNLRDWTSNDQKALASGKRDAMGERRGKVLGKNCGAPGQKEGVESETERQGGDKWRRKKNPKSDYTGRKNASQTSTEWGGNHVLKRPARKQI